jgi:hypothetical protein
MKATFRKFGVCVMFGLIAAAMALCGPTSAIAVTVTSSISGSVTTSTGSAVLTGSTIEMVDFNGVHKSVLTTLPGVYKADTTGLTAPLLFKSGNVFGYSETLNGIANITPSSDLIVNQDFQAFGTNAAAEFILAKPRPITPIQLQSALALDKDVFQQPYAFYKIPSSFNPLTTKFSFTSGFGKFLGNTTFGGFGSADQTVQASLGTLDWSANFHGDPGLHWSLSVWKGQTHSTTTWSVSGGYSYFPSDPNAGATYGGVANFYKTTFLPILKHEGKLLDSFNLLPLYNVNFLNGGKDATLQSQFDATDWRPLKFSAVNLGLIRDYTPNFDLQSHNRITLAVDYSESLNGGSFIKRRYETFICNSDGTGCSLWGDQQLGTARSEVKYSASSISSGVPTALQQVRASLISPQGNFLSANLSDAFGTYFTSAPMNPTTEIINLQPIHNLPPFPFTKDKFSLSATVPTQFAYNDSFTYDVALNPAGTVDYDSYVFGSTNETVNWLLPDVNGTHLLGDFKLGTAIAVKLKSPPLTFIPIHLDLRGQACNATQTIDLSAVQKFFKTTATSGSVIVPKMVMGQPTVGFKLSARYEGLYNQNTSFNYYVGATCPRFARASAPWPRGSARPGLRARRGSNN